MQSDENIRLAYRNIKRNTGSTTAGYDGLTIEDIKQLSVSEVISKIQRMFEHYKPQAVRRVFIPKTNGKTRRLPLTLHKLESLILQYSVEMKPSNMK
uniref:hypothetical protein n=1 Tax=Pueribacillus theae TaxID=2171751 RepID=UPI001981DEBA|nr:hypothetical protein [Pueribacillus theae]